MDRFPLESDDISDVNHFTMKNIRFIIKLNTGLIVFVFHYGYTPASVKNGAWRPLCLYQLLSVDGDDETQNAHY